MFMNDNIGIFIHQIDLALTNYAKSRLAPYNIAPEQSLIMSILWDQDGLTQKEIAEKLDKNKEVITRMVISLEKKGFIQRTVNQTDQRLQHVFLTAEGKKLMDHLIPLSKEINELICIGVTPDELKNVEQILSRMRQNIQDI